MQCPTPTWLRVRQYGHSHPTVARSLEMLANLLGEMGQLKDSGTSISARMPHVVPETDRVSGVATSVVAATRPQHPHAHLWQGAHGDGRYHGQPQCYPMPAWPVPGLSSLTLAIPSPALTKRMALLLGRARPLQALDPHYAPGTLPVYARAMPYLALGASHPTSVWALNWLDRWPDGGVLSALLSYTSVLVSYTSAILSYASDICCPMPPPYQPSSPRCFPTPPPDLPTHLIRVCADLGVLQPGAGAEEPEEGQGRGEGAAWREDDGH
eukprot:3062112-Rhodomonas_salina.1